MGSRSPRARHSSRRHRNHHVKEATIERLPTDYPPTREITVVEVRNPQTQFAKNRRMFTDYEVCLKTNSKAFALHRSSVRRRYSDFVWLQKWLQDHNEGFGKKTPSLPPKKFLKRFDEDFIEERMKGLQRFLKRVIEYNVFLSDKALHLFLQSSLNISQIEAYLLGKPIEIANRHQSTPSLPELTCQPVYSSLFTAMMSSSLENIPERCERRSLLSVAGNESASLACSYQSASASSNASPRVSGSSGSEDSSTEADALMIRASPSYSLRDEGVNQGFSCLSLTSNSENTGLCTIERECSHLGLNCNSNSSLSAQKTEDSELEDNDVQIGLTKPSEFTHGSESYPPNLETVKVEELLSSSRPASLGAVDQSEENMPQPPPTKIVIG